MRKIGNKFVLVVVALVMLLGVGCSDTKTVQGTDVESVTTTKEKVETTPVEKEEKKASAESEVEATSHVIVDMAGREVEIPTNIEKVFSVNNNGTILLYTLCPEKMVGWNSKVSDTSIAYMTEEIANLPMLGSLYGNSSQTNPEEIMLSQPDVILFMDGTASEKVIAAADKIQSELMIPVVIAKGDLHSYDKVYKFVGEILGEEEQADILAEYYRTTYDKVTKTVEMIPEEEKLKVYYAREGDGLSTETDKSTNAQLISLCGGVNVAILEDKTVNSPQVSIEQVINWNPDVILTGSAGFIDYGTYQEITTNSNWSIINAVSEGNVYPTPQVPYNWFDRPPSVNRIIGMNFVLYTLYPDYYEGDIVEDVINFYELFYHYELSEDDAMGLLNIN